MTTFFVPTATPTDTDEQERLYASLARLCRQPVPPAEQRVFRIEWIHDGEEWTAEVGRPLQGRRTDSRRRQGRTVEVVTRLSDAATVVAIFPGNPTVVVTDAAPVGGGRSAWMNPFLAGVPTFLTRFAVPQSWAATDRSPRAPCAHTRVDAGSFVRARCSAS